jgi:hypothetical protein
LLGRASIAATPSGFTSAPDGRIGPLPRNFARTEEEADMPRIDNDDLPCFRGHLKAS